MRFRPAVPEAAPARPVVGVLCCNEVVDRPVQVVATRFVRPLTQLVEATVLLVPAVADAADVAGVAAALDGLLLTGSRSHVAPERYGAAPGSRPAAHDPERDEVALALSARMIEGGKPVFGICRGMQELNVLFGGTLCEQPADGGHHRGDWDEGYDALFDHHHAIRLADHGRLARATGCSRLRVNSVHQQGVDRLGAGLTVEARAEGDDLVEAIWARPCGADVLAVQWHPEWDADHAPASRAFFALVAEALRTSAHSQRRAA